MTLVPQTDNKLQRHLVSKFRTKKKSAAIQLKFGMVAGIWLLYMPTKFQPNWQQKNSSKKILCLLWLLKPQMNVPLLSCDMLYLLYHPQPHITTNLLTLRLHLFQHGSAEHVRHVLLVKHLTGLFLVLH